MNYNEAISKQANMAHSRTTVCSSQFQLDNSEPTKPIEQVQSEHNNYRILKSILSTPSLERACNKTPTSNSIKSLQFLCTCIAFTQIMSFKYCTDICESHLPDRAIGAVLPSGPEQHCVWKALCFSVARWTFTELYELHKKLCLYKGLSKVLNVTGQPT